MKLPVKRAYDAASKADGTRILVDRLWPRGVTKAKAHIDLWAKDLTPTNDLRKWFHGDPEKRFKEFSTKYKAELKPKKKEAKELLKGHKKVTLVTAVKDIEHSHIPTLTAFLEKL